ncbi:hypothetical protein [Candidatus Electronema sp. PJ]|uniref:hypothetical protein n=1 Tax=Candidatus Electronema sp. PJ TaxID=3401572 RepID=UPI003AA8F600
MTHSKLLHLVTDLLIELNGMNFGPETAPDKIQRYDELHAMLPQSSAEEKTAFVPTEEVLYRVELTPEKLIITVDAGLDRPVEVIFRNKLNS